jgi:hypothetical protein
MLQRTDEGQVRQEDEVDEEEGQAQEEEVSIGLARNHFLDFFTK